MASQSRTNLSTVIEAHCASGGNSTLAVDDAGTGRFVVLRHEQEGQTYAVGFHLVPIGEHAGQWDLIEFAVRPINTEPAGMTGKTVRALPIGKLLAQARKAGTYPTSAEPETAKGALRFARPSELKLTAFRTDGRGKQPRTDFDYAELAMEYALLVEQGDTAPAKTLAATYGGSAGTWANRVADARRRGMLTPVRPGEAGGALTDKAGQLLFGNDPTDEELDHLNQQAAAP